jgi:hypothetical protein
MSIIFGSVFGSSMLLLTEYALLDTLFSSLFPQGERYMVVGQPTALGHKTPPGESSL